MFSIFEQHLDFSWWLLLLPRAELMSFISSLSSTIRSNNDFCWICKTVKPAPFYRDDNNDKKLEAIFSRKLNCIKTRLWKTCWSCIKVSFDLSSDKEETRIDIRPMSASCWRPISWTDILGNTGCTKTSWKKIFELKTKSVH